VNRGDIYHVDLNPTQGREQAGSRFVLIVSPAELTSWGRHWLARSRKAEISPGMPVLRFR
jgi:mRNA-degrading endonuclease toxin of MazEF toxin-antitoxin module